MKQYKNTYLTKRCFIVCNVGRESKVEEVNVYHRNSGSTSNFMTLGYLMDEKVVLQSSCFGSKDFAVQKELADLCSEAFSLLGEELELLDGWKIL